MQTQIHTMNQVACVNPNLCGGIMLEPNLSLINQLKNRAITVADLLLSIGFLCTLHIVWCYETNHSHFDAVVHNCVLREIASQPSEAVAS